MKTQIFGDTFFLTTKDLKPSFEELVKDCETYDEFKSKVFASIENDLKKIWDIVDSTK